jgi:hypothetical protein
MTIGQLSGGVMFGEMFRFVPPNQTFRSRTNSALNGLGPETGVT